MSSSEILYFFHPNFKHHLNRGLSFEEVIKSATRWYRSRQQEIVRGLGVYRQIKEEVHDKEAIKLLTSSAKEKSTDVSAVIWRRTMRVSEWPSGKGLSQN